MTATTKVHPNNSATSNGSFPRKSLSTQLDRLDQILDGLDEALQGAVADAVKEAVSLAVSEAVRATFLEIVTNQDLINALRGGLLGQAAPTGEPNSVNSSQLTIRQRIAMVTRWTKHKLTVAGRTLTAPIRKLANGTATVFHQLNQVWHMRRPLLIAAGIGVIVGAVVGCAAAPWLAGVVSGVGAMGTALGAQLTLWTRRLFAGLAIQ